MTMRRELQAQLRRNTHDGFTATMTAVIDDPSPNPPEELQDPDVIAPTSA